MSEWSKKFARLMTEHFLVIACFSVLIIQSGDALSNGLIGGCSKVRIEGVAPLDFGNLLFSRNSRGFVTMDSRGRMDVPVGVSASPATSSSPAVIEISGPSGSDVYISLRLSDRRVNLAAARLVDLKLSQMSRILPKVGDYWVIKMPPSTKETSMAVINMTGVLNFNGVGGRSFLSHSVEFHCEFVSQSND